jgi:hypothetical protein
MLNLMVELKKEEGSCNVGIWEWLLKLVKYLEADDMSSEESGVEINDKGIVQKASGQNNTLVEEY